MKYRTLGRTGISVSEIGMGCEGMVEKPFETVLAYVDEMEKLGVNIIDLYSPNPSLRRNLGRAMEGRREKFVLQAHLCSIWKDGQYKRTRDIQEVREGFFCENGFFEFGLSTQKIFGVPYPVSGGGYVRLSNWDFIKSIIWQYIKKNNNYVFYLHPFELTRQKIPFLKDLKAYDKYYLKAGITSYGRHIEQIIKMLKKCGYTFVTFEELTEILNKETR